ncbi:hypothetical protein Pelo_9972 [Pelomyxa schiedti]|nr:hypothetical protein Pelo_9972 [Pelomyxa schiedti]
MQNQHSWVWEHFIKIPVITAMLFVLPGTELFLLKTKKPKQRNTKTNILSCYSDCSCYLDIILFLTGSSPLTLSVPQNSRLFFNGVLYLHSVFNRVFNPSALCFFNLVIACCLKISTPPLSVTHDTMTVTEASKLTKFSSYTNINNLFVCECKTAATGSQ